MSLVEGCSRDVCTLLDLALGTQYSDGGQNRSYTTAARGTKSTSLRCRIQQLQPDEYERYGIKGTDTAWRFMFTSNPQLGVNSAVTFTDQQGVAHTQIRIVKPSKNCDEQGRLWVAIAQEMTNRN